MERVAIIDMGSNSIRFIVIQVADNKSYHLEYQQKEAIRLGRGMSETGRLNPEGVERAMACLHVYKHMMEVLQVTKCIAVATAAARNAADGEEFIARIKRETGIDIEVISGEREAYLGYLGVVNTIDERNYLQFDLGGASIEVSLVRDRKIVESVSVPIGAVTVTDAFNLADKVTGAAVERSTMPLSRSSSSLSSVSSAVFSIFALTSASFFSSRFIPSAALPIICSICFMPALILLSSICF